MADTVVASNEAVHRAQRRSKPADKDSTLLEDPGGQWRGSAGSMPPAPGTVSDGGMLSEVPVERRPQQRQWTRQHFR